jgi:hypothetical protein
MNVPLAFLLRKFSPEGSLSSRSHALTEAPVRPFQQNRSGADIHSDSALEWPRAIALSKPLVVAPCATSHQCNSVHSH